MSGLDNQKKRNIRSALILLLLLLGLSGCGGKGEEAEVIADISTEPEPIITEEAAEPEYSDDELQRGEGEFSREELADFARVVRCEFSLEEQALIYELEMDHIPGSNDAAVYLFGRRAYEEDGLIMQNLLAYERKGKSITFVVPYDRTMLFKEYIPAIAVEEEFYPIAGGSYLRNPDILAPNQWEYPDIPSKKGLLIDPVTLDTEKLTKLEVKHAIYNIPLSLLLGESTDEAYETIEFEYDGNIYLFNGAMVASYDGLFKYLEREGMYTTAIVLNDWNPEHMELIHPLSREKTQKSLYYAFNTAEEDGVKLLEATALFLAERYSQKDSGMVYNWVIANEINEQSSWNYMDTSDIDYYAREFEKGFRIFYQAIRSRYANAKVYFSIDNQWNSYPANSEKGFNGKDLLEAFNRAVLEKGNYDWGLAIHPYPDPLTRVNFWKTNYDKSENAKILTLMNLSTLTSVLEREDFRDTKGKVRSMTVTELGFSSKSGEKLQTAAFIYGYYILDANPYVDAFILNRQTDSKEEMRDGLSFGLYKTDLTPKYIRDVFCDIDKGKNEEYEEFMLKIVGAESMEEALSWAR